VTEYLESKLGIIQEREMQRPTPYRKIPKAHRGTPTIYDLENGGKIDLYDGQRIAIYLYSLNANTLRHLTDKRGGIVQSDNQARASAYRLSSQDVATIASDVVNDPELKKIADAYHFVFNDNSMLKGALNRTSMRLFAEEVADEPDYDAAISELEKLVG